MTGEVTNVEAPRLLLLKHQTEEADLSPELRFLHSMCVAEARALFDAVDVVSVRPGQPLEIAPSGPVLLFGAANTFLGRRSLAHMLRSLEVGAGIALPAPVSRFKIEAQDTPHTLRGFERVERRLLENPPSVRPGRASQLPLALLAAHVFRSWIELYGLERVLTDDRLLETAELDGELARVGIYYPMIDYYGETREDVLPLLQPGVRRVLEIGCARGHTGALLQERLGCQVTGVEMNPEVAADAATRLSRVVVGNIEELDLKERFDAIVATELLEHLAEPAEFLARMKSLLEPGGRIVLSTPNVGHHSIVEDLLAGRWDYVPMGLLCYTHLRFFTRATLEDWISRLGFASWEIHARKTALPERFAELPAGWEVDVESLATEGFLVVLKV